MIQGRRDDSGGPDFQTLRELGLKAQGSGVSAVIGRSITASQPVRSDG